MHTRMDVEAFVIFMLVYMLFEHYRSKFCSGRSLELFKRRRIVRVPSCLSSDTQLRLVCGIIPFLTLGLTLHQDQRVCSLPR